MVDSSHCKIKYDTEDDQMEVSDFYDFTLSYPEEEGSAAVGSSGVGEDEGWETCSDDDDDIPEVDDADDVKKEDLFKGPKGEKLTQRTITVNEQVYS